MLKVAADEQPTELGNIRCGESHCRALSLWPSVYVRCAAPAGAQVAPGCPEAYYLATDGRCYPGSPPVYAPPVYEVAPPVYQPPVVLDGFGIGLGIGIGGGGYYGGYHGGGYRERRH